MSQYNTGLITVTVPYRAVLKRRRGVGIELNKAYFLDGAAYCKAAAEEVAVPTLFDLEGCSGESPENAAAGLPELVTSQSH